MGNAPEVEFLENGDRGNLPGPLGALGSKLPKSGLCGNCKFRSPTICVFGSSPVSAQLRISAFAFRVCIHRGLCRKLRTDRRLFSSLLNFGDGDALAFHQLSLDELTENVTLRALRDYFRFARQNEAAGAAVAAVVAGE